MTTDLLRLLAVGVGAATANSYYNQAVLGHITHDFRLPAGAAVMLPVLTQAGNALGVVFVSPLGDRFERKAFILVTICALLVSLAATAMSPSFAWLIAASLLVGLFATVSQQMLSLALHLAPRSERGHILGKVSAGLLIGILLARTVAGVISDLWGWRVVFWFAMVAMLLIATALALRLPRVAPTTSLSYPRLIQSLVTLLRTHRLLRQSIIIQFLLFAAFMAFWSNLAVLLTKPPYDLGATAVGLLAGVGVAGALAAPAAGRFADQRGPRTVISVGALLIIVAFLVFLLWQNSIIGLVVGTLIMDLGVQSSQIANQARVSALDPMASSRLNAVFMSTMFLGGATGAGIGGACYAMWGWSGTCVFAGFSAATALLLSMRFS